MQTKSNIWPIYKERKIKKCFGGPLSLLYYWLWSTRHSEFLFQQRKILFCFVFSSLRYLSWAVEIAQSVKLNAPLIKIQWPKICFTVELAVLNIDTLIDEGCHSLYSTVQKSVNTLLLWRCVGVLKGTTWFRLVKKKKKKIQMWWRWVRILDQQQHFAFGWRFLKWGWCPFLWGRSQSLNQS